MPKLIEKIIILKAASDEGSSLQIIKMSYFMRLQLLSAQPYRLPEEQH